MLRQVVEGVCVPVKELVATEIQVKRQPIGPSYQQEAGAAISAEITNATPFSKTCSICNSRSTKFTIIPIYSVVHDMVKFPWLGIAMAGISIMLHVEL